MKRIYMTLGLVAALGTGAFAQRECNIETVLLSPTDGQALNCDDSFTLSYIFINRGPDALLATDTFSAQDPEAASSSDGWYFVPEAFGVGDTIAGYTGSSHMNMTNFLIDADTMNYVDAPFANGDYVYGVIFGGFYDTTAANDHSADNDNAYAAITVDCGTGIADIFSPDHVSLTVYPNPVINGAVHFQYEFQSAAAASVRIMDLAGREVLAKNYGRQSPGMQSYSLNTAALSAGTYIIEFMAGDQKSTGKFTVQR